MKFKKTGSACIFSYKNNLIFKKLKIPLCGLQEKIKNFILIDLYFVKLTMGIKATWIRLNKETDEIESYTQPVKTKNMSVYSKDELHEVLDKLINNLEQSVANLKYKKSGYTLKKYIYFYRSVFS